MGTYIPRGQGAYSVSLTLNPYRHPTTTHFCRHETRGVDSPSVSIPHDVPNLRNKRPRAPHQWRTVVKHILPEKLKCQEKSMWSSSRIRDKQNRGAVFEPPSDIHPPFNRTPVKPPLPVLSTTTNMSLEHGLTSKIREETPRRCFSLIARSL